MVVHPLRRAASIRGVTGGVYTRSKTVIPLCSWSSRSGIRSSGFMPSGVELTTTSGWIASKSRQVPQRAAKPLCKHLCLFRRAVQDGEVHVEIGQGKGSPRCSTPGPEQDRLRLLSGPRAVSGRRSSPCCSPVPCRRQRPPCSRHRSAVPRARRPHR